MAKFSCHGSLLAWNAWCCLVLAGHAVASEREWPRYAHDQAHRSDIAPWRYLPASSGLEFVSRWRKPHDRTSPRCGTARAVATNASPAPAKNEPLATTGPLQLDIDGTGTLRDAREALRSGTPGSSPTYPDTSRSHGMKPGTRPRSAGCNCSPSMRDSTSPGSSGE